MNGDFSVYLAIAVIGIWVLIFIIAIMVKNKFKRKNIKPLTENEGKCMDDIIFDNDVYLTVIFSEKDKVKELGARWNQEKKSWYIPKGKDSRPFMRYYPYTISSVISAKECYLLSSLTSCWKCGQHSEVFTFVLLDSVDLEGIDDDFEGILHTETAPLICSNVISIAKYVHNTIKEYAPFYRFDYSKTMDSYYWINHCSKCNAPLGDFYMHNEPGGAFFPEDDKPYSFMKKIDLQTTFDGNCTTNYIPYFKLIPEK